MRESHRGTERKHGGGQGTSQGTRNSLGSQHQGGPEDLLFLLQRQPGRGLAGMRTQDRHARKEAR